jgi:hypothetical protein
VGAIPPYATHSRGYMRYKYWYVGLRCL